MGGSGSMNLSYHYKDSTEGDIWNNARFRTPDQEFVNFNVRIRQTTPTGTLTCRREIF